MSISSNLQKVKTIFKNGRFENPFGSKLVGFKDVYGYLKERNKIEIKPLTDHEKEHVHPVLKPDFSLIKKEYDAKKTMRSTWIGHSTCLIQMEGYTFITDPVFSRYITPFPYLPIGPKRIRDPACKIQELPKIDFVVISHAHYDHLDRPSVIEINKLYKPKFFVPRGLKSWFLKNGIENVQELDWWDEVTYNNNLKLIYTPANHGSQRGLFDRNSSLWGGWVVKGENKTMYFAGDTADHHSLFKSIGHHYGPFDFSLIPIGAYDQFREFMKHHHCNVEEAVRIHKELTSKRSFGVHWGTFILSTEPLLEPPKLLITECEKANIFNKNEFFTSKIGETAIIED
ncbi:hypothetical protein DICPUDRAFT_28013 [Dictyostelium purpureum]|uniref:Metallo-beta-lactamase domain-containing protein n=1 Tax=Dictyostelium purpureum TaxID=5786 RepID=F0ZB49_DICPU|nr:uncharacterized protein DICPUDRAFT_28013 [Dictyostelium purpureum]EGC38857.1 hypothetical protein DICPUDRAFT_28013 [Dictyostelium purpureum]|eukprot:XP_003284651.1 hypothetical protein DICPUDRAFT_28013 [Dictyostelium purpureum]